MVVISIASFSNTNMIYRPFILLPFIIQPNYTKRGFIDYCALPKKIKKSSPNPLLNDFIASFNLHQYHFRLTFDHSVAYFDATDKPDASLSLDTLSFAHSLFNFRPQYLDVKKKTMLEFQKNQFIKRNLSESKWKFTHQSKTIGHYEVFKAVMEEEYQTRNQEIKKRLVTAWFCPDLPFAFGPLGYNDLPGLILELDKCGHRFIAEQIHINPKEFNEIVFPE